MFWILILKNFSMRSQLRCAIFTNVVYCKY